MHLAGSAPGIARLAKLAADLGLPHEVESGVLRVPSSAACRLLERASSVLAPLEAQLIRVVTPAVGDHSVAGLIELVAEAPTLAELLARAEHARLLAAVRSRAGVSVGFQPVVDLSTTAAIGFEALLRVRVGSHDVAPAEVLAAADAAGWLCEVDAAARSAALADAAATIGERLLFLNVMPKSLPDPDGRLEAFADEVRDLGLDPGSVVLEMPIGPPGILRRQVDAIFRAGRDVGFLVGLDNVRTERDLDALEGVADVVKLDRSLVRGLPSSGCARTLGALVNVAGERSSLLVAQGIETPDHLGAVRDLGLRFAQGWLLGRPGPIPSLP